MKRAPGTAVATLLILVVLGITTAFANSVYEENLREVVEDTSDVAVIRLDRKEAVTFVFDGEVETCGCGYRYEAEVLTRFKGEGGTLLFFGPRELAVAEEYLVLALRTDPNLARELAAPRIAAMEGLERARYNCRIDVSSVYVRNDPRSLRGRGRGIPEIRYC